MTSITATAYARVGLLGNPSDGYGGSTLGFTFEDFFASARLEEASTWGVATGAPEAFAASTLEALEEAVRGGHLREGAALQAAAVVRFAQHLRDFGSDAGPWSSARGFSLSYDSSVPRQVGLAGSSAIVTATLRALMQRYAVAIHPAVVAEMALAAEVEELKISAGPQDRVIQAYEGLLYMDFAGVRGPERYRPLDPSRLPPLFVAWDPEPGVCSGALHDDVRQRFERGDPDVVEALETFPKLALQGVACLAEGDHERFHALVNENFDTRAKIWTLRDRDRELVDIGRRLGAATKFSGSGGAVVGVLNDTGRWPEVLDAYRAAGFDALRPRLIDSEGKVTPL